VLGGIWCSRRIVTCRTTVSLFSAEYFVSDVRETLGLCLLSSRVTVRAGSLFGSCEKLNIECLVLVSVVVCLLSCFHFVILVHSDLSL
jgi:hypothetical protein